MPQRDILITPRPTGTTYNPKIEFSNWSGDTIQLEVLVNGSIAYVGDNGQLFTIADSLEGSIISVNNISGLPIFEVFSDKIVGGTYNTNTFVVSGTSIGIGVAYPGGFKFYVSGNTNIDGYLSFESGNTVNEIVIEINALSTDSQLPTAASIYDVVNLQITASGSSTFLGLTDTISSYNANRILFESTTDVIDFSGFTYDSGSLFNVKGSVQEGCNTTASGDYSHAEGYNTTASGNYSHAEGITAEAIGQFSHAESASKAIGQNSHSEASGYAVGQLSHAEGFGTTASGYTSHVEGYQTEAAGMSQSVIGVRNIPNGDKTIINPSLINPDDYVFIIGNGYPSAIKSNALAVDWRGSMFLNSGLTLGTTLQFVDEIVTEINALSTDSQLPTAASIYDVVNLQIAASGGSIIDTFLGLTDTISSYNANRILFESGSAVVDSVEFYYDSTNDNFIVGGLDGSLTNKHVVAMGSGITISADYAYGFGSAVLVSGDYSYAQGYATTASGDYTHAEGYYSKALGNVSHAEGSGTTASGLASHSAGYGSVASGDCSHASGRLTTASGFASYAHGGNLGGFITTASGDYSHAEGLASSAVGDYSFAVGYAIKALGNYSIAQGSGTLADGEASHAEGSLTDALGDYSHAEGRFSQAYGGQSHAEGQNTTASGSTSHAEGYYTIAQGFSQLVTGFYNIVNGDKDIITSTTVDRDDYAFIIGNGTSGVKSNALAVSWKGNLFLNSGLTLGTNANYVDEITTTIDVNSTDQQLPTAASVWTAIGGAGATTFLQLTDIDIDAYSYGYVPFEHASGMTHSSSLQLSGTSLLIGNVDSMTIANNITLSIIAGANHQVLAGSAHFVVGTTNKLYTGSNYSAIAGFLNENWGRIYYNIWFF